MKSEADLDSGTDMETAASDSDSDTKESFEAEILEELSKYKELGE